jgi:hypothetical protein
MRVDHPELHPVSGTVEADEIRAQGGAAVQTRLPDPLGELGDQEVVAVELVGANPHEQPAALDVGGKQSGHHPR